MLSFKSRLPEPFVRPFAEGFHDLLSQAGSSGGFHLHVLTHQADAFELEKPRQVGVHDFIGAHASFGGDRDERNQFGPIAYDSPTLSPLESPVESTSADAEMMAFTISEKASNISPCRGLPIVIRFRSIHAITSS